MNAAASQPARVHGLRAPMQDWGVHQSEPGEDGGDQAPDCGAAEIAVDHFGDERGDHQHEEEKSVAEPLNRSPVDGAIQRRLDFGICGRQLQRRQRGTHGGTHDRSGGQNQTQQHGVDVFLVHMMERRAAHSDRHVRDHRGENRPGEKLGHE